MDWKSHKKQLLKDPAFRETLTETELEYQVARALIEARLKNGLTQAQLAKRLKTTQSVISRAENAIGLPSLTYLKRISQALDTKLHVYFS